MEKLINSGERQCFKVVFGHGKLPAAWVVDSTVWGWLGVAEWELNCKGGINSLLFFLGHGTSKARKELVALVPVAGCRGRAATAWDSGIRRRQQVCS
ncbi:hypothetical protein TorRG33x02_203060 [Trema orientale]|uniref:Uncharacterized protein n=1 Tax=Trema orientale TaxID=63057 RepID=A0A2P5EEC6_TREOI|nr:hypothetical protein TorRG33x02_203060 [Trema orientale]